LLENEDGDSYQQVLDAIVTEAGARSFLRVVAAKDYADNVGKARQSPSSEK
jgi:hypothetical protein